MDEDGITQIKPDEPLTLSFTFTRAEWQEFYNEGAESVNAIGFHAQLRANLINNYLLPAGDR